MFNFVDREVVCFWVVVHSSSWESEGHWRLIVMMAVSVELDNISKSHLTTETLFNVGNFLSSELVTLIVEHIVEELITQHNLNHHVEVSEDLGIETELVFLEVVV